jgi:hypothetical protein
VTLIVLEHSVLELNKKGETRVTYGASLI